MMIMNIYIKNIPMKKRQSVLSISSINLLKKNFQSIKEDSSIKGRKLFYSNKKMKSNLLLNVRNREYEKERKKISLNNIYQLILLIS